MTDHFGTNSGMVLGAMLANRDDLAYANQRILQLQAELKRLGHLVDQRDAIIVGQAANITALKAELPKGHRLLQDSGQKFSDGETKLVLSVQHFEPAFKAKAQELKVPQKLIDSVI